MNGSLGAKHLNTFPPVLGGTIVFKGGHFKMHTTDKNSHKMANRLGYLQGFVLL